MSIPNKNSCIRAKHPQVYFQPHLTLTSSSEKLSVYAIYISLISYRNLTLKKNISKNKYITDLSGRFNPANDTNIDGNPCCNVTQGNLPIPRCRLLDILRDIQSLAKEKVQYRIAPGAFGDGGVHTSIRSRIKRFHRWTLGPRQRTPKRTEQVEQTPGNDHTVVTGGEDANNQRGEPDASHVG